MPACLVALPSNSLLPICLGTKCSQTATAQSCQPRQQSRLRAGCPALPALHLGLQQDQLHSLDVLRGEAGGWSRRNRFFSPQSHISVVSASADLGPRASGKPENSSS